MVEKELGERNFGFDSLKYLKYMNRRKESARFRGTTASALRSSGGRQSRSIIAYNSSFLLHVAGIKAPVSNDGDQTETDVRCHNASRLARCSPHRGPSQRAPPKAAPGKHSAVGPCG
ncbi:unnamed protein product [Boreogadus saida]